MLAALAYAPDERRPPVPAYSAGDGFVQHWAGFQLDRSGCDATLNDHLTRANAKDLCDAKRTAARRLADQLTAAMSAAFEAYSRGFAGDNISTHEIGVALEALAAIPGSNASEARQALAELLMIPAREAA